MLSPQQTAASIPGINVRARVAAFVSTAILPVLLAFAPTAQAQTFTVLYRFSGGEDGKNPYVGLSMDNAGNLYGTTAYGGFFGNNCQPHGCGCVFKLAHQGGSWLLHPLYQFQGSPGDGAAPSSPVIFGPEGVLYGATAAGGPAGGNCANGCGTVFKLTPPANFCRSFQCNWSETELYAFSYSDGANPRGEVAFDAAGDLYGATSGGNMGNGTVYELTPASGAWILNSLHAFTGGADGSEPNGGVQLDPAGNVYGTTLQNGAGSAGTVFQLVPSQTGWGLNTLYSFQVHSSNGSYPWAGVILDPAGNLYGATCIGGVIFELSPSNGSWTYNPLYTFSGIPCPMADLAMDAAGNLYGTTEQGGIHGFGNVFKLTPSNGSWIYTDLYDFTGGSDGGTPYSNVLIDANGNLYGTASIGGTGNGTVWEITP